MTSTFLSTKIRRHSIPYPHLGLVGSSQSARRQKPTIAIGTDRTSIFISTPSPKLHPSYCTHFHFDIIFHYSISTEQGRGRPLIVHPIRTLSVTRAAIASRLLRARHAHATLTCTACHLSQHPRGAFVAGHICATTHICQTAFQPPRL